MYEKTLQNTGWGPPKPSPDAPGTLQNRARAPLGQHLAARRHPRARKRHPRSAQEAPKRAQERPKSAQEAPKSRPKREKIDVENSMGFASIFSRFGDGFWDVFVDFFEAKIISEPLKQFIKNVTKHWPWRQNQGSAF